MKNYKEMNAYIDGLLVFLGEEFSISLCKEKKFALASLLDLATLYCISSMLTKEKKQVSIDFLHDDYPKFKELIDKLQSDGLLTICPGASLKEALEKSKKYNKKNLPIKAVDLSSGE